MKLRILITAFAYAWIEAKWPGLAAGSSSKDGPTSPGGGT